MFFDSSIRAEMTDDLARMAIPIRIPFITGVHDVHLIIFNEATTGISTVRIRIVIRDQGGSFIEPMYKVF